MPRIFVLFWIDETGETAIEYGLILSFVVLVIIASLRGMSASLSNLFVTVSAEIASTSGG